MPLFAALAATWPTAEVRRLGPWTLRRGDGGGNRVCAATTEGAFERIDDAEALMRGWGQRPQAMIRPGEARLDAALAARGYVVRDPTLILTAAITGPPPPTVPETAIDCEGPLACMSALWAAGGVGAARLRVMDRAPPPRTWLLGRRGDRPAACAFLAVHDGVAMLHALEVAPDARRQGMGSQLTHAARSWASDRGATTLALAVTEANGPARALYARLGFREAARYHYRIAPQED